MTKYETWSSMLQLGNRLSDLVVEPGRKVLQVSITGRQALSCLANIRIDQYKFVSRREPRPLYQSESRFLWIATPVETTLMHVRELSRFPLILTMARGPAEALSRTNKYKTDGKEYPFEGPYGKSMMSVKKTGEHETTTTHKYAGGHTLTQRAVLSPGKNDKGEPINARTVYERQ